MTEYAFFIEKADRWGKDMAPLWGNLNICPQLHQLKLPCHAQAELSSISSLKVWEDVQNTLAECKARPTTKHSFKQFPSSNNSKQYLTF